MHGWHSTAQRQRLRLGGLRDPRGARAGELRAERGGRAGDLCALQHQHPVSSTAVPHRRVSITFP
ncbi:hypothetical protein Q9966_000235 [Columba livia]|nr:hypothetical protein Q9966_000235 [Columba livia]